MYIPTWIIIILAIVVVYYFAKLRAVKDLLKNKIPEKRLKTPRDFAIELENKMKVHGEQGEKIADMADNEGYINNFSRTKKFLNTIAEDKVNQISSPFIVKKAKDTMNRLKIADTMTAKETRELIAGFKEELKDAYENPAKTTKEKEMLEDMIAVLRDEHQNAIEKAVGLGKEYETASLKYESAASLHRQAMKSFREDLAKK